MLRKLLTLVVFISITAGVAAQTTSPLKFVDKWLPSKCSSERQTTATVDTVMLHFCSDVVKNPQNPFNVDRIIEIFTEYTVSAHYLIGRDGTIYNFVPENRVAFHAGKGTVPWAPERNNKLNHYSIGIEMLNVGSQEDMKIFMSPVKYKEFAEAHPDWIGYTNAQYAALGQLLKEIQGRNPAIKFDRKHIVGHNEYAGAKRRTDPGTTFDWSRIGLPPKSEF